jgi:signal transduction histidine kinase
VRRLSPDTTRVMLTGYSEMRSAIAAINEGNVFRFLIKPCDPSVVAQTMIDAVDHHRLVTQDREFMASKLQTLSTRLRSAERLAALGTLASAVSEELSVLSRKLDAVLLGAGDLGTPVTEEMLRAIKQVRDELNGKVLGLRSVEFPGSFPKSAVDLSEVAISALDVLRGAGLTRGVRVDIRASKTVAKVMVDRPHLERIIIILLNNAIDATENDKGCARYVSVAVGADPVEGRVSFVVEDNGSGVPSDRLESLFRRGSDAPLKGHKAGHRLATVRQLIEAHGGRMWISSVLSGGTTVGFELPRASPVAVPSTPPGPPSEAPSSK